MKKASKLIALTLALCAVFSMTAFAAGEPAAETADSFTVTIRLNGEEYEKVEVDAASEGGVYTFGAADLFDVLGLELSYDEETDVATIEASPDSLMSSLLAQMQAEADENSVPEQKTAAPRKLAVVKLDHDAAGRPDMRRMEKTPAERTDTPKEPKPVPRIGANLDRALLSLPSKDQK